MSDPKNWPEGFIYTREPFSDELHPHLLAHLLSTGKEEDGEKIHPLIERGEVHPGIEIQRITDPSHPLANGDSPQRGIFAKEILPEGTHLGTYSGEILLMNAAWDFKPGNYDYALVLRLNNYYYYVIDSKKWANEMAMINDYRGIAKAPNVTASMIVHLGCYYPMFSTIREILPGEELLWDYGDSYWEMRKKPPFLPV